MSDLLKGLSSPVLAAVLKEAAKTPPSRPIMTPSLHRSRDYSALARKIIDVEPLPMGACYTRRIVLPTYGGPLTAKAAQDALSAAREEGD